MVKTAETAERRLDQRDWILAWARDEVAAIRELVLRLVEVELVMVALVATKLSVLVVEALVVEAFKSAKLEVEANTEKVPEAVLNTPLT